MIEKLKPCPFCGRPAEARDFQKPFVNGWIGCPQCHCFIEWIKDGKRQAIASWNRREGKSLMGDHDGEEG